MYGDDGNYGTERGLLGAVLLNPKLIPELRKAKVINYLRLESSRLICAAIFELADQEIVPDPITLRAHMVEAGTFEKVGGFAYVTSLDDGVPVTASIKDYIRIVKVLGEKHNAARLLEAARIRLEDGEDPRDVLKDVRAGRRKVRAAANAQAGDKPTDDELCERWLEGCPPMIYARDAFYRYSKGLWRPMNDHLIRKEIKAVMVLAKSEGIKPSNPLLSSIFGLAQSECSIADDCLDVNPQYLIFGNGAFNLETFELEEPSPDLYMTSGISYDYDPKAEAPAFESYIDWLQGRIGEKRLGFLQEYGGLCATIDTSHEIAVWLQGDPGCGKNTLVEAFKAALPNMWVKLGLRQIESSRFSLSRIAGKRMAIASEQPGVYIHCVDLLEDLISGQEVTVESKFRDSYDLDPTTLHLLWTTNREPRWADPKCGLARRVWIVRFGESIPADEVALTLKQRIKKEGPGVMNWLIAGLKRLRERGYFDVPDGMVEDLKEFHESMDTFGNFIAECVELGHEYEERGGWLYRAYAMWCRRNGYKPKANGGLSDDYKRFHLTKTKPAGVPTWKGIRLTDEWLQIVRDSLKSDWPNDRGLFQ